MTDALNNAVFPKVFHRETVAMTDSLKVAEYFGKQHKNVLQRIERLECSEEFRRLNFKPSYYLNEQNKKQPMYLMTQDGFTLLVMGFTGKKAMQFKEAFICKFNEMRKQLVSRSELRSNQHRLNDAIKYIQGKTGKHDPDAYPRENNLVYRVALGKTCKQWLIDNGFSPNDEIRAHLSEAQLKLVDDLLAENATMIKLGMTYNQRRARLEQTALDTFRQDESNRSKGRGKYAKTAGNAPAPKGEQP